MAHTGLCVLALDAVSERHLARIKWTCVAPSRQKRFARAAFITNSQQANLPSQAIGRQAPASGINASMNRKHALSEHGLTAAEEKFAALIACGTLHAMAYRDAFNKPNIPNQKAAARAREWLARDRIEQRVRSLLAAAEIAKLDSIGQYHRDLMAQIAQAVADNNLTAAAALMRLRGQTIGALADKTIITDERATTDAQLVAKLAKGDADKASMLKAILGDGDAYKTA